MRIIKEGKPPEERIAVAECDKCGCQFEFSQSEGQCYHDVNSHAFINAFINCPTCKNVVWVGANQFVTKNESKINLAKEIEELYESP